MDKFVFLVAVATVVITGLVMFSNALRRKQQSQMHNRLLDKLASAQDLTAFLQTSAGREYVLNLTDTVGSPVAAIISSVRTGVVLCVAGAGFFAPSVRAWGSALPIPASALGTLLIFLGIGFIASAGVSFALARMFHLTTPRDSQQQ